MLKFNKLENIFSKKNPIIFFKYKSNKINKNNFSSVTFFSNKFPISSKSSKITFAKNPIKYFSHYTNLQNPQEINYNKEETENKIKTKFAEIENDINNYNLKIEFFEFLKFAKIKKSLEKEKYAKYIDKLFYHELLKSFEENSFCFISDIIFLLFEESSISNEKKWEEFFTYLKTNKKQINFELFVNFILRKLIKSKIFIEEFSDNENSNNSFNGIIKKQLFDNFVKDKLPEKYFFENLNFMETLLLLKIFPDEFIEQGKY